MDRCYINDLDEIKLKIQYEETLVHFEEAMLCYNTGAYKASTILLWLAIFHDLINKIKEMSTNGDSNAEQIIKKFNALCEKNDVKLMQDFEKEILKKSCDELMLISTIEREHLNRIKVDRNYAAHPYFSIESKNHHYKEQLKSHILHASNYLFIQPPISGKYRVDEVFKLIQQDSFPTTVTRQI